MVEKESFGTFSPQPESTTIDYVDEKEKNSDLELLQQASTGRKSAFDQIVLKYNSMVYRFAFRFFNNRDDAFDVSQEVFLRAFRSLHTFEGRSSVKTWLFRITINTCLTLKTEKARAQKSFTQSIIDWFSRKNPVEPSNEVILKEYQSELKAAIQNKLSKIPEIYRSPVILRDIEGCSHEQIAQILDIKEGTVKSRINRGRRLLQDSLEPFFKERPSL